jgi:hypothetical protein
MPMPYQIAAYYAPAHYRGLRDDYWHGAGWTEGKAVRAAVPHFPGHQQHKVPLWGNEDDPAADHGASR